MTESALVPWTAEPETLFSVGFHWPFSQSSLADENPRFRGVVSLGDLLAEMQCIAPLHTV
jgi:hypothetical protein